MMLTSSLVATVILIIALIAAFYVVDESWFSMWVVRAHDFTRENFISVTPFLPRVKLIDGTATYIVLCFLCFLLCWAASFLLVKVLNNAWTILNKVIEIVITIVVFFFSSVTSTIGIQIIKCAIIPVTAVILYFTWDTLKDLVDKYF